MLDGTKVFLAQLVDCGPLDGQTPCTTSGLKDLVGKILNYTYGIVFSIMVLVFIWGAFLLLTSGGTPDRINQGKKAMTSAVIGLVITLSAWLVINTLITTFTSCSNWTGFTC